MSRPPPVRPSPASPIMHRRHTHTHTPRLVPNLPALFSFLDARSLLCPGRCERSLPGERSVGSIKRRPVLSATKNDAQPPSLAWLGGKMAGFASLNDEDLEGGRGEFCATYSPA